MGVTSLWQTAVRSSDLDGGGLNAAEGGSLAVGQLVHGGLGEVEAGGGVVDGEDVDGAPAVAQLPASSALDITKVLSATFYSHSLPVDAEERGQG